MNWLHALLGFTLISFLSNCKSSADSDKAAESYKLVWADEFNESKIDTTSWNYNIGGEGWGNNEQEYYTDSNATIEDGNLVINGRKETIGANGYTSSRMTTQGKHEFKYGKIEAKIKIPIGQGIWPAFWMLGANISSIGWPDCGEIDIMEHINSDSIFYGTLHWSNNGLQSKGSNIKGAPEDYHVYSIEWTKDSITWFFDEKKYHQLPINNPGFGTEEFHQPFFILLNLAIGGDWPGQIIDDSKFPARMYIDYVRVYQKS